MKERRFDLDNLKGILILIVVFGHLLLPVSLKGNGLSYEVSSFIYFFHMPVFLFISGLLSKKVDIKNYLQKMVLLYFVFNFSLSLLDFYINGTSIDFIHPYYSMWYLIVLMIGRILISINDNPIIFFISLILSLFSGFSPINNTFALSRIVGFMPFFLFGYFLSKKDVFSFKDNRKIKIFYHLIPCVLLLYIIYQFTLYSNLNLNFYTFGKFSNNYEFIFRLVLVLIDFGLSLSLFFIIPNKRIPFLSMVGKNSLVIYLFHRFITLLFEKVFIRDDIRVFISIIVSIFICLILGNDFVSSFFNKFILFIQRKRLYIYFFLGLFIITNDLYLIKPNNDSLVTYDSTNLDNCVKISYIGDMLLFGDDLSKAKDNETYDFSPYFDSVSKYFGDYTFGVLEGVLSEKTYVSSNYLEQKELKLLYPTAFMDEISKNIDFVNICTNHILDGGDESLSFTKQYLESNDISYTDGNDIKIVDIEGIKFAVISYTYGTNNGELSSNYLLSDKSILEDFKKLFNYKYDKVIVFAHSGTEFSHLKDYNQDYYAKLFSSFGADIVFFDHSHNTEPIEFIDNTLVFYGAGNFSSSYTDNDCDKGAICNIYIDKDTKEILLTSIIPIKSIVSTKTVTHPEATFDIGDISSSNIILNSMINREFPFNIKEAFYGREGFVTRVDSNLKLDEEFLSGPLFFMGDSITYGYLNKIPYFGAIDFNDSCYPLYNLSGNGWTSDDLLKNLKEIDIEELSEYNNFIIAIGVNDVRYLGKENHLISNLESILELLPSNSTIYIINPWLILDGDLLHNISIEERDVLFANIEEELINLCKEKDIIFLNLNPYIKEKIGDNYSKYMIDYIHPNEDGIKIYSESLIYNLKKERK